MSRILLGLLLLVLCPCALLAQTESKVGVNTREPSENLHIKGTVRVESLPNNGEDNAIFTDALGQKSASRSQTFVAKSMVVADDNGVLGTIRGVANWFFMPSITIDTNVGGVAKTIDLYEEFRKQFQQPKIVSAGAPAAIIQTLPARTALYYYVTDYDASVLTGVSIDAQGIMTYNVSGQPTENSYVNIVFVLK